MGGEWLPWYGYYIDMYGKQMFIQPIYLPEQPLGAITPYSISHFFTYYKPYTGMGKVVWYHIKNEKLIFDYFPLIKNPFKFPLFGQMFRLCKTIIHTEIYQHPSLVILFMDEIFK